MRIYYRADKRIFTPGAEIATAGEFVSRHPRDGALAESLLDERKPSMKPKRNDCLMLFEDEECAKDHWAKMTGGKLYTVSVAEGAILHRGDMNIVNEIAKKLIKGECAIELADSYWTGTTSGSPCIEVLVSSGTVVEQLGSEAERVAHFKKMSGISSSKPLLLD